MDKITNIHWLSKEDVGFEPTHAFTRLTVFKTVPFSQAWVILRTIKLVYHLILYMTSKKPICSTYVTFCLINQKNLTEARVNLLSYISY